MKKIISLVVVIALVLCMTVTAHAAADCYLVLKRNGEVISDNTDAYKFVNNQIKCTVDSSTLMFVEIGGSEYKLQGDADISPTSSRNYGIYKDASSSLLLKSGTYLITLIENGDGTYILNVAGASSADTGAGDDAGSDETTSDSTNSGSTTTQPTGGSKDVKGTFTKLTEADTVYSVDIKWGGMSFNYNEGEVGTWNPNEHKYDNSVNAAWTWTTEGDNNKITVTNNSNTPINAKLTFAAATDLNVTGAFKNAAAKDQGSEITDNTLKLESAEPTGSDTTGNAQTKEAYFHVTGGSIKQDGTIGTITVTIEDAA